MTISGGAKRGRENRKREWLEGDGWLDFLSSFFSSFL